MKTLRQLSNRNLDKLQARMMGHIWNGLDLSRRGRIMVRIGNERLRRLTDEILASNGGNAR